MPDTAEDSWLRTFIKGIVGDDPHSNEKQLIADLKTRFTADPAALAAALPTLPPDLLKQMDHATLYNARKSVPSAQQGAISPYEHRAFAREATAENPLLALPILAGTLAYQPYKMLTDKSRSPPSWDQIMQGFTGVGEGLYSKISPPKL